MEVEESALERGLEEKTALEIEDENASYPFSGDNTVCKDSPQHFSIL